MGNIIRHFGRRNQGRYRLNLRSEIFHDDHSLREVCNTDAIKIEHRYESIEELLSECPKARGCKWCGV